MYRSEGVIVV